MSIIGHIDVIRLAQLLSNFPAYYFTPKMILPTETWAIEV